MNQFWLVKQEPSAYGWAQFAKEEFTSWTGVRNFQARNFLRSMKKCDLVLFYHSGDEKQVVGLARVKREAYPDPTAEEDSDQKDKGWVAVDLEAKQSLNIPVTLHTIKKDPSLKNILLIRQSRLSVMPLKLSEFRRILGLAKTRSIIS